MRYLRKRVTCRNADNYEKNRERISKISDRYISKMKKRGWIYIESEAYPTGGNVFFHYERYFTILKPNLKYQKDLEFIAEKELEQVLEQAKEKGNVTKDGIYVMTELKKLGWYNKSYSKDKIQSALFYSCGYSGGYNSSKLVRIFN